jgi:hypothetical protein
LHQNYPNPFNSSTIISFAIPLTTQVNLSVFDITGRRVATLFSGLHQTGTYRTIFDGSVYASGVYFYRLEAGQISRVGKMVLMK